MIDKLRKLLFGRPEALPFSQSMDLTGLPIVTLCQGDKRFNFLLDTGSNNNIIHSAVLDSIQHTMTCKCSDVFGMEGQTKLARFCDITLSYKGNSFEYEYLICDMEGAFGKIKAESGITLHGLLGSHFFREFRYVIDFNECIAYSKK